MSALLVKPGYARGWRIWRVELHDDRPRLTSIAKPTTWTPREPLEASCWRKQFAVALQKTRENAARVPVPVARTAALALGDGHEFIDHRSPWPGRECHCGIWALDTETRALEALWARCYEPRADHLPAAWAIGEVKLWGRVVECEHGFRGERGYPLAVTLLDASYVQLMADKPIDVEGFSYLAWLAAHLGREYRVRCAPAEPHPVPSAADRRARMMRFAGPTAGMSLAQAAEAARDFSAALKQVQLSVLSARTIFTKKSIQVLKGTTADS